MMSKVSFMLSQREEEVASLNVRAASFEGELSALSDAMTSVEGQRDLYEDQFKSTCS